MGFICGIDKDGYSSKRARMNRTSIQKVEVIKNMW